MTTPTDSLADALKFTPDDLTANRAGDLSPVQRARLQQTRGRSVMIAGGVLVVVVLAATTLLFLGQRNDSPILTLVGLSLTVINAVYLALQVRGWLRLSGDIGRGTVQSVCGQLEHTVRVIGRAVVYTIRVDDVDLTVSKATFLAFEKETAYCLYLAPGSRVLLAAEPV